MTTTDNNSMSLSEIGRRIDLNKQSGWGLEKGTPPQLNMLALYCQKFHLLPGDDVTLYEGRPWITIDGRVKLMRRNPDYRGYTTKGLSKEEKEQRGYDPDDIVIEAAINVAGYPEPISARGKVSKAERIGQGAGRLNPIAKIHPAELAEKRAISRAERLAFGTESYVDDEDVETAVRTVIEEQRDPVIQAERAATYKRIYGTEDDDISTVKPQPERDPEIQDALIENEHLLIDAKDVGVTGTLKQFKADPVKWQLSDILAANDELRARITSHQEL